MESFETPKHIIEQAQKSDADYESAVRANEIVDKVVDDFKSSGDIATDTILLRKKLETGGINFKHLGNRSEPQTSLFLARILQLKVKEMEKAVADYRFDTINTVKRLSEELLPDDLQDVRRRAEAA